MVGSKLWRAEDGSRSGPPWVTTGLLLALLGVIFVLNSSQFRLTGDFLSAAGPCNSAAAAVFNPVIWPPCLDKNARHVALRRAELGFLRNMHNRRESLNLTGAMPEGFIKTGMDLEAWLLIPTYDCPYAERLARWGEGGKWVCLEHNDCGKPPAVVSVGSRGDTSFEAAIFKSFHAITDTFDPFLSPLLQAEMSNLEFLKFHSVGLVGERDKEMWQKKTPNVSWASVSELLEQTGKQHVDIFKMDCDGCEFGVIDELEKFGRSGQPFWQILMEIHWIGDYEKHERMILTLERLGYRMFHAEPNPYWHKGYEVAFIHESLVKP